MDPTGLDRPPIEDPVPRPLAEAIAAGWRGLSVVTGRDPTRPVTLVHAGASPPSQGPARLSVAVCRGRGPVADRAVLRLAGDRCGPGGGPGLVIDLRLAGARALVREMAAAGSLPMLDLSGPCAGWGPHGADRARAGGAPARRGLRARRGVARGRPRPWAGGEHRLPAGGRRAPAAAHQRGPPRRPARPGRPGRRAGSRPRRARRPGRGDPGDCPRQTRLPERAAARGRVTVAEVALGHRAVLTGLRTVPL